MKINLQQFKNIPLATYWLVILCCFIRLDAIGQTSPQERQPNIVLILADDMGYHDAGCYGQQHIKTPHIDQLANEGVRFTDFYAGSPVCAPSRSVLLTGQHAGHTKVRGNYARTGGLRKPPGSDKEPSHPRVGLAAEDTTIAQVLQKAGYRTALFGKWHLSGYDPANLPVNRGFDEFRGPSLADFKTYQHEWEFRQSEVKRIEEKFENYYTDDVYAHYATDFIRRQGGQPFFLFLSLISPHKPLEHPDQGIYADKDWNEMSKNYAAMVSSVDDQVGKVMQALKAEGLDEHTMVIFCSDNGGEYREYPDDWAAWTQLFQSNKPLRGGKADMYEGGIRVPAIIRWPEKIEAGIVNEQPWYFPDFMPTLANIAGVQPPEAIDGIDMMPILSGKKAYPEDRYLYWEFDHEGFMQALRWKDWKLIRWTHDNKRIFGQEERSEERRSSKYPSLELYNLATDISETNNVVEEHPEVVEKMVRMMGEARTDSPNWPLTEAEKALIKRTEINHTHE